MANWPQPGGLFGRPGRSLDAAELGPDVALGQIGLFLTRHLPVGRWTKVSIDVTFAPPRLDVSFDGVSVASRTSITV